jgi:arylsulfatase A-like enzyme
MKTLLAYLTFFLSLAVYATDRPNFIVILIDDMGWRDMGFSGSDFIDTPHTDALARHGVIFSQAYSSAPNCAPTRACLMSGQYTPRHGVFTVVDARHEPGLPHHKIVSAHSNAALATESVTIAEALKSGGYATAMYGMWNLGRGRDGPETPTGQGFDDFKQPRDLGFDKDAYINPEGEYLTDAFTSEGIRFIEQNKKKPFFLYLAYHAVHHPFQPKPELLEKYQKKARSNDDKRNVEYAATVEAVDQNIARLDVALQELGLKDNTIVVFTSDNGGNRQNVAPLNGSKGSLYEGGLRVPAGIWGAGIRHSYTSDSFFLSMDIYPTLLELAGIPRPENHILDGISFASLLKGGTEPDRDTIFFHFPSYIGAGAPSSSMRKGDYKLIEQFESGTVELYDLRKDIGESKNLAQSQPMLTKQLYAELLAWQEATGAPRPTQLNPHYEPQARPMRGRENRGKGGGGNRADRDDRGDRQNRQKRN